LRKTPQSTPSQQNKNADFQARIERLAGRTVARISRPGGKKRDVLRIYFETGPNWILVRRSKSHRAEREIAVLDALAGQPGMRIPERIGSLGEWSIISDLGNRRMSLHIQQTPSNQRWSVAEEAIAGIFEFQNAANACPAVSSLPSVTLDDKALLHIAKGPARTCVRYGLNLPIPKPKTLLPWIGAQSTSFIKGDCRAANIVLDEAGNLGWIDFEYAGLRHGSEDIAWFLCDETLPLPLDGHLDDLDALVRQARPDNPETYLKTLVINATLHAGTRLRVIGNELDGKSWLDYATILNEDLVGVHPTLTTRLAQKGALLADQYAETRPLVDIYNAIADKIAAARREN
jgi:phosphotransferase family enzyme